MRWGILGCGNVANDFVKAFSFLPPHQKNAVYAVAASNLDRAREFAHRHNIGKHYGSYQELLSDSDVDIVYVGLVNALHKTAVLAALASGKHVICEKPIGVNRAEFEEMKTVAKQYGKFLMDGVWTAFLPVYGRLRQEIDKGSLGEVKFLAADFSFQGTGGDPSPEMGGGLMTSTGYYLPFLAYFVFGEQPSKITANGIVVPGGSEKSVGIQMTFPSGGIANLHATKVFETNCSAYLFGTKDTAIIPRTFWCADKLELANTGIILDQPFEQTESNYPNATGFLHEILHVGECVEKGLQESPILPWKATDVVLDMCDEIRKQVGVKFPMDT